MQRNYTSYYHILGVTVGADLPTIKKAYRGLALKFHPDKTLDLTKVEREAADNRFKEIVIAYETLSDEQRRREYDKSPLVSHESGITSTFYTHLFGDKFTADEGNNIALLEQVIHGELQLNVTNQRGLHVFLRRALNSPALFDNIYRALSSSNPTSHWRNLMSLLNLIAPLAGTASRVAERKFLTEFLRATPQELNNFFNSLRNADLSLITVFADYYFRCRHHNKDYALINAEFNELWRLANIEVKALLAQALLTKLGETSNDSDQDNVARFRKYIALGKVYAELADTEFLDEIAPIELMKQLEYEAETISRGKIDKFVQATVEKALLLKNINNMVKHCNPLAADQAFTADSFLGQANQESHAAFAQATLHFKQLAQQMLSSPTLALNHESLILMNNATRSLTDFYRAPQTNKVWYLREAMINIELVANKTGSFWRQVLAAMAPVIGIGLIILGGVGVIPTLGASITLITLGSLIGGFGMARLIMKEESKVRKKTIVEVNKELNQLLCQMPMQNGQTTGISSAEDAKERPRKKKTFK